MEKVTVIDTQSVIWLKTRTQTIKTVTFSPRQMAETVREERKQFVLYSTSEKHVNSDYL